MTDYDLWATQGSIRAAHYNLPQSPVPHTVSALPLAWDGAELIADESGELTTALRPVRASRDHRRAAAEHSYGCARWLRARRRLGNAA